MKTRKVLFFTMLVFSMVVLSLIIGSRPIYAKNGPADDWAVIELCNDNYDRVYDNGDINNSLIEGMTYDKDTNTLTLTNFKSTCGLYIAQMGEDFKLNLVGENEVGRIYANMWNDWYTCNLNITGYGSLTVNKDRDGNRAIEINYGKLVVDETVTLKLYVAEEAYDGYNPSVVYMSDNSEDASQSIIFKNGDTPTIKDDQSYSYEDVTMKAFAYLEKVNEPHITYTIVEKDNKKFGMSHRWENYRIRKREVRYDSAHNKYFFVEPSDIDIDDEFPAYDTLDDVLADGYTVTDETFVDDSFVIYTGSRGPKSGVFTVKTDKDNVEHAVFSYYFGSTKLYYAYDITDSKITLDNGEEYIVLNRNKEIDLDDLTTKRERVYYDEYTHSIPYASLEVFPSRYEVIKGAYQEYTLGEGGLFFTINADYQYFENGGKVLIDGEETDKFTSKKGSTIVEFNDEYLNTLSEGEHTIKFAFNNGRYAETQFTINKVKESSSEESNITNEDTNTTKEVNNPKTGDNILMWFSLMMLSIIGIVGIEKFVSEK